MLLQLVLTGLAIVDGTFGYKRFINATDGGGGGVTYSPARPPSVPLAVRSPYTSAWSTTAGGGTLNSNNVRFWTGDQLGWEGIVVVDGKAYEYLGIGSRALQGAPNIVSATPQTVSYDSQYSNFTFLAGPVKVTASFFSPVTPKDICRTSIPLSYLTTTAETTDGRKHSIQFYSDINAAWISRDGGKTIIWDLHRDPQAGKGAGAGNVSTSAGVLHSWIMRIADGRTLTENGDFPEWGNFTYSTSPMGAQNFTFQNGYSVDLRNEFLQRRILGNVVDSGYRGWGNREVVFAYSHDMGTTATASVRYTIGSVQTPIIRYLNHEGLLSLRPWWEKCYGDMYGMIAFHWNDFSTIQTLGNQFESQLKNDVDAYYLHNFATSQKNSTMGSLSLEPQAGRRDTVGHDQFGQLYEYDPDTAYGFLDPSTKDGVAVPDLSEPQAYYSIVALSARQVMHSYVYAIPPVDPSGMSTYSDPLMFQKEISSDGNVNTVDVLYPALPFFLWANPEMLRYTLQPLYEHQEGGFYPRGYCMHDVGSNFPNATGHIDGNDEYMPVEESGNFILMSYAYYKFSGNKAWLSSHYGLLKQFATYLKQFSLIPAAQLSTDDFAGTLTNQTNLAIKGIVGLQAMAAVARVVGHPDDAAQFADTASHYYNLWESYAIDPKGQHALLAYEWRSSWGLMYNIYPDKLLNLGIVNSSVYDMQSKFYPTVSQAFGVPLDNRHHYTKSDWMIWTAATSSANTRRLFVNALAFWLNSTSTDHPFTDLYETIDTGSYPSVPNGITFKARPVVGGHFALLALLRSGQNANATAGSTTGSLFGKNSTDVLGSEPGLPSQASSDLGPA